MKKSLLLITFVFGGCYLASATECPTTTLDVYEAAGFSCNIGISGDITFSGFGYFPSGSIPIPATDVLVTPETIGGEQGFQFNAPWFALPGGLLDTFIDFTATCDACEIDDLGLSIAGAGAGTGGLVRVDETSPALTGTLTVGAAGGTTILSDMATFPPVGSVSVSKDILLAGGTSGLGSAVSSVTNLFSTTTSTVPEPSLLFLSAGLLGLLPFARRKFVR
jgi:hypothetical protein